MTYSKSLRTRYGVDSKQHILLSQGHRCAVCGCKVNTSSPLDHNHDTGKVRGIICLRDNRYLTSEADNLLTYKQHINSLGLHHKVANRMKAYIEIGIDWRYLK